jgi:Amt family ammonium transporter
VATATAALAWMFTEWTLRGKPGVLGIATGAIAGLVAITPASGSVGPMGAMAIGLLSGVGCFFAATSLKRALGYDDALDVFGVHAVGGIIGAILTGVFVHSAFGGVGLQEGMTLVGQVWAQFLGVVITIVYTGVLSFVILKIIDMAIGLRVPEEQEVEGLDLTLHNERGYIL